MSCAEAKNALKKEHGGKNVPADVTVCWPVIHLIIHWSILPVEKLQMHFFFFAKLCGCGCGLPHHTSPRPGHVEALQTRIPASRFDSARGGEKKKSSEAVTGIRRREEEGGLFLNALAPDQMLPVRAVEGAGSASAGGFSDEWELSAQLLSSPPATAAAAGVVSRIFFLWQDELDFTSSANMYSAALLLMLSVGIYADSMEGPTGKRCKKN